MNLQKLQTQREGHRRFVDRYLINIEEAKENSSLLEFNAILESIEAKVQLLESLNEKILSNTDIEFIEDEIFQAEEYSLKMEIKLRQLREFRNGQEKNATITYLRQKYWIPAIRQCVRSVLRTCVICARVIGKPYRAPDPPPLPKIRVEEAPPFSVTGVDFTGVLYIKNETGSESKCYICLFTCATTRAVHLEVVPDLSTDSFLQAFRRFSSRKSLPKLMVSDNATTYLSAANQLKQLFQSTSIQETLSTRGTEWKFIPKRAPWYGGFWERLIGLTKTTLKKILGRAFVSMETLRTIVTEIEAILNDRPITFTSSNLEDSEPLTPSHLLYGRRVTSLPYDIETGTSIASIRSDQSILTRRAKAQANIIDHFWRRWRTEYLTSLREYHKTTGSNERSIRAGDVVQVHDEGPRLHWKLAVVQELITGNDGLVRAAKIKTVNGFTTRPIVKLYPLETVTSE